MPGPTPRRLIPPSCEHRTFTKDTIDTSKLPLSYQSNTLKEEHLLQVADNFSCQYSHLCPDRVPLFLHPLNECEVPVRPGGGGQGRGTDLSRGWWGQHINSNAHRPQQARCASSLGSVVAWSPRAPPKGQSDTQCGRQPLRPALCRKRQRYKTKQARTRVLASFLPTLGPRARP